MLDIQRYLRSGGTLASLLDTYSITSKRHRQHENLVLLKYNQIDRLMDLLGYKGDVDRPIAAAA